MEKTKHRAVQYWAAAHGKRIHTHGFVLLGAPGIGKSTFVSDHHSDWVDEDEILYDFTVHTEAWHTTPHSNAEQETHYRECDAWLQIMRECGIWVVGSLFWEPDTVDGIVLLDKETHKTYVRQRNDLNWEAVEKTVNVLKDIAKERGIPTYASIEEAAAMAQINEQIRF
jgi:adenylate kinase family enzyme